MRNFSIVVISVVALLMASPVLAMGECGYDGCRDNGDVDVRNNLSNQNENDVRNNLSNQNENDVRNNLSNQNENDVRNNLSNQNENDVRNENNNRAQAGSESTSRATGGDAAARATGGDSAAGVFRSGNSRNDLDVTTVLGVAAYSGIDFEDAHLGNSRNDLAQDQSQQQGQEQAQMQSQNTQQDQAQDTDVQNDQDVNVDARDQSSYYIEDSRDPVASAATVFASACSAGISAQSYGFGGALATTNPMCDLALAAEMAKKLGTAAGDVLATELVNSAASFALARTNPMRRYAQWIPFIGQLF